MSPRCRVWLLDRNRSGSIVLCTSADAEATTSGGPSSEPARADSASNRWRVVSASETSRSKGRLSFSGKWTTTASGSDQRESCSYMRLASSGRGVTTSAGASRDRARVARTNGAALASTWTFALARARPTSASIDRYCGADSSRLPNTLRLKAHNPAAKTPRGPALRRDALS